MASKVKNRPPTRKEIEKTRKRLLVRKSELWEEVWEILDREAREEYQDWIETMRDEGDVALAELKESTLFSFIDIKVEELEMIEGALNRIEEGEYGRCIDCGQLIQPGRLEIMPHALRCRDCQGQQEKIEKIDRGST